MIFWLIRLAVAAYVFVCGYGVGAKYPPCCPGEQRGCNVESGALGVSYCRESGFGWERCQAFTEPYPQALWRKP